MKNIIATLEAFWAHFSFRYLNGQGRCRLWLKLAKMMENNVPLLVAIDTLRARLVDAGRKNDPTAVALNAWGESMRNGARFAESIAPWVSHEEAMLITAGEQSGNVIEQLKDAVTMMVAKKNIQGAIIGGVAYPLFLSILSFGVMYIFSFKIIPAFTKTVRGAEWKGLAHVMVVTSNFCQVWLAPIALVFILLVVIFFISLPTFDGPWRVRLDRYPPFSIYRIMQGSSWLIAMAALSGAGMRTESSLELQAKEAPAWLKNRLIGCLSGVRSGLPLGDALAKTKLEFPDREIIDDLGVYSTLSGMDKALAVLGAEWLDESVARIQSMMKVVFGVSIMVVGLLIALMVSGMMQMQSQLGTMIQQSMH